MNIDKLVDANLKVKALEAELKLSKENAALARVGFDRDMLAMSKLYNDKVDEVAALKKDLSNIKGSSKPNLKVTTVTRGNKSWCDEGYHEITCQAYQGILFHFGTIGSLTCLIDNNLNPVSGKGYHKIDLAKGTASIGAKEFAFDEHLTFVGAK